MACRSPCLQLLKRLRLNKTQVKRTIDCILAKGAASRDADGRVYNRRMVRTQNGLRPGTAGLPQQKGADRVADRGAAARAKSGAKGGAVTKRKWQQLQQNVNFATANLPEQNGGKGATASLSLSKKVFLWEKVRATSQSRPNWSALPKNGSRNYEPSGGSLATALFGERAREPPYAEPPPPRGHRKKQPAETTRAEIDAMLAAKQIKP